MVLWRDENTHGFVEIEFSDQSQHRNAHFTDHNGVTMAALSGDGVVFGSARVAQQHLAASVFYR